MKQIMNLLVNSCKKTSELIDKQQITSLSAKDKLQLQVHKSICSTCNAYEKQSKLMEAIISNWFANTSSTAVKFSQERKNKIIDEINKY